MPVRVSLAILYLLSGASCAALSKERKAWLRKLVTSLGTERRRGSKRRWDSFGTVCSRPLPCESVGLSDCIMPTYNPGQLGFVTILKYNFARHQLDARDSIPDAVACTSAMLGEPLAGLLVQLDQLLLLFRSHALQQLHKPHTSFYQWKGPMKCPSLHSHKLSSALLLPLLLFAQLVFMRWRAYQLEPLCNSVGLAPPR